MAYTPAFSAQFAKPLLMQAIALIQRDQAAAMAVVNSALKPINEFHVGRGARTALPWITLVADGPRFIPNDDLLYREGDVALAVEIDVGEFDQEVAQLSAHDYVRVVDIILTTAGTNRKPSLLDWMTSLPVVHEMAPSGMTTPNAAGTVKDVKVQSHRYTVADVDGYDAPIVRGTLNVLVHLIEK